MEKDSQEVAGAFSGVGYLSESYETCSNCSIMESPRHMCVARGSRDEDGSALETAGSEIGEGLVSVV